MSQEVWVAANTTFCTKHACKYNFLCNTIKFQSGGIFKTQTGCHQREIYQSIYISEASIPLWWLSWRGLRGGIGYGRRASIFLYCYIPWFLKPEQCFHTIRFHCLASAECVCLDVHLSCIQIYWYFRGVITGITGIRSPSVYQYFSRFLPIHHPVSPPYMIEVFKWVKGINKRNIDQVLEFGNLHLAFYLSISLDLLTNASSLYV